MLYKFGRVYSVGHVKDREYAGTQVKFIATREAKSMMTISVVADDISVLNTKSPGKIIEAYVDNFEALSERGRLIVMVKNIGRFSAVYNVSLLSMSLV